MRTIELHYNVLTAQGHRFAKDVLREWPDDATLGDVMSELTTELESFGCSDITITRAARHHPNQLAGFHPGQSDFERASRTGQHIRTSVAPNAEREAIGTGGHHHVPRVSLSIKSDITPETLDVIHYPGEGETQVHFHIRQGISGRSIYLREADARLIRDFLNEFYPASAR